MQIKVPASSANLGPGFDSIGMAVSLYLTVDVLEPSDKWVIDHDFKDLPHDESNMIIDTALKIKPDLAPHHLKMQSDIPVAHGLGSSSSAIVAGIELANVLGELQMSNDEKVAIACEIEGHPDNVAPAILGGLVIGTNVNGHFDAIKAPLLPYALAVYIPSYNLKTADARAVLPDSMTLKQATHGSAIANVLVAGLFANRYDLVGELMEADEFHEQPRAKLVPELAKIREIGHEAGALATYLSGAGPTVMTIIDKQGIPRFKQLLLQAGLSDPLLVVEPDTEGVQVIG